MPNGLDSVGRHPHAGDELPQVARSPGRGQVPGTRIGPAWRPASVCRSSPRPPAHRPPPTSRPAVHTPAWWSLPRKIDINMISICYQARQAEKGGWFPRPRPPQARGLPGRRVTERTAWSAPGAPVLVSRRRDHQGAGPPLGEPFAGGGRCPPGSQPGISAGQGQRRRRQPHRDRGRGRLAGPRLLRPDPPSTTPWPGGPLTRLRSTDPSSGSCSAGPAPTPGGRPATPGECAAAAGTRRQPARNQPARARR